MNPVLKHNLYLVKEHIGLFKAANNFDIFDPQTHQLIMICREEKLGFFTKLFRFSEYKRMTPFHIEVKTANGDKVLTVRRGMSIFLSTVEVFDENDALIGIFEQHFFSIGGHFDVLNARHEVLCSLRGKWTGWDFRFENQGVELAAVTKKWAGIGKELFTSADNYMLSISEQVGKTDPVRQMILAAVLCIDMVLKE